MKSLTAGLAQDTERWIEIQSRYYRKQLELWARLRAALARRADARDRGRDAGRPALRRARSGASSPTSSTSRSPTCYRASG